MYRLRSFPSVLLLAVLVATAAGVGQSVQVHASGPCDEVFGDPDPPIGGPEPASIGGNVANDTTSAPIQGATMKLFQCNAQGAATHLATVYTNSSGNYSFASLDTPYWYYVEAVMTGPLYGMTPIGSNLTSPIGLGDAVSGVDFRFW